jgi:hypothetical protein
VLNATNKRLLISESRGDLNRCAHYRGNLIHMTCTLPMPVYVCHLYALCGQFSYVATFYADPTELDRFTALEKKAPDFISQPGWVVHGTHLSFSPNTTIEAVCLSQTSVDEQATRLTRPISPAWDQYIQYLLAGANSSVLNWHKRGRQPWRCQLASSHSPTFPTDGPPLFT